MSALLSSIGEARRLQQGGPAEAEPEPANVSRLILDKLAQYAADPAALARNVKALKGEPGVLRLRVGDWRILFTEDGTVIAVIRIAPRGNAYE